MCSDNHLAVCALAASEYGWEGKDGRPSYGDAFRCFKAANMESLRARYGDPMEDVGEPPAITRVPVLPLASVAKLLASFRYQSCEHEGWKDSRADRLTVSTMLSILDRMCPDSAPWSI